MPKIEKLKAKIYDNYRNLVKNRTGMDIGPPKKGKNLTVMMMESIIDEINSGDDLEDDKLEQLEKEESPEEKAWQNSGGLGATDRRVVFGFGFKGGIKQGEKQEREKFQELVKSVEFTLSEYERQKAGMPEYLQIDEDSKAVMKLKKALKNLNLEPEEKLDKYKALIKLINDYANIKEDIKGKYFNEYNDRNFIATFLYREIIKIAKEENPDHKTNVDKIATRIEESTMWRREPEEEPDKPEIVGTCSGHSLSTSPFGSKVTLNIETWHDSMLWKKYKLTPIED